MNDPLVKLMLSVIHRQSGLLHDVAEAYRSTKKYTEEKIPSKFEELERDFYVGKEFVDELIAILDMVLEEQ